MTGERLIVGQVWDRPLSDGHGVEARKIFALLATRVEWGPAYGAERFMSTYHDFTDWLWRVRATLRKGTPEPQGAG